MPSKLAAAIRAKYPGAYDGVDDAALEKAVLAKYPQYASMAEPEPAKSNTEMSTADLQAANLKGRTDLPSAAGFAGNVLSSGGRFAKGVIEGLPTLAKIAALNFLPQERNALGSAVMGEAPRMAKAAGQALKQRYGGVDNALSTAYHDPVGAAADVSTVAGGVGLAANAAKAPRVARIATAISDATNPMQAMRPIAKAVEYGTAGAIRPMLKPSKPLRRQQGSALEIERTALKEGAVTEGLAKSKQGASAQRASDIAAQSTAAVPKGRIVQMPKSLDKVQRGLSQDSDLAALAQVEKEAAGSLTPTVSASDLLDKRRYLDRELNNAFRAAERGGPPVGIRQSGQQEMLGNVRRELRTAAPNIAEADDMTRRLGLVRSALNDAGLRAGDIPMGAALLGGGLGIAGVPGAGVAGAGFGLARTFPQIPLALGSAPVRATAAAATPMGQRAALLSALIERLSGGQ
jgi:hypothetical protein